MNKFAIPVALAAVALAAACSHRAAPAPAPVVVVPQQQPAVVAAPPAVVMAQPTPTALRAGTGRVESITGVPTSSGTGSTAPGAMRRLGIKMDDGTVQYVDTDVPNIAVGERVSLTSDGYIRPGL
jgi:hypothetical protein